MIIWSHFLSRPAAEHLSSAAEAVSDGGTNNTWERGALSPTSSSSTGRKKLLHQPPLGKLISSDVTERWEPRAEVLQMLCHNAEHGRQRAPRQLSTIQPSCCLFDFSLHLLLQLQQQTAPLRSETGGGKEERQDGYLVLQMMHQRMKSVHYYRCEKHVSLW